jgi:predicted ATPase/class 3 adenylate cyclase
MTDIPAGNITFLFTDIEGSTKLSQDFPEKLHVALERHNQILKEVMESYNGFIYDMIGDSFFCAFENAVDTVKAAVQIQTELKKEIWDEAVIKVRIGIHSGSAEWNGERYMGYITLARTARIMEAAYGEQILISNNTHSLYLEGSKTQSKKKSEIKSSSHRVFEVNFRDFGERRLKDVIEPIRLFQIESDGLREEFPPLKTLDARPNNLPIQLTSFIGREKEMKFIKEELKLHRLLSLTGAGGAGKTRFALQTAAEVIDEFENGVWFVDLSALKDIALLSSTMITALGIKEESMKTSDETLIDYLKDKEILIILDNCEQLINACALLTERLLSSCPRLKMISTSREAMNCGGEFTYRIPPLTQPDPNQNNTPEELIQYESVRLFIERALSVNPNFRVTNENAPALAEVCSRLDGIPLAIELASARTKILSIEKIYERLDDRFNLLTGGKRTALPRQQTLRALIDWSYDLLSESEKILWSRLSVFNGGWTLEAAEEVCSDETIDKNDILDLLSQLTEKSVIIYDGTKDRYRILESLKQYGIEKLSERNEIFIQHLNYFLELSEKAAPELKGENAKIWLDRLEANHNNLQSAIEWGVSNANTEKAAQVASALGKFWNTRGYFFIGIKLFEIILDKSNDLSKTEKALILNWIGIYNKYLGKYKQSQKFFKESLELRRELRDNHGISVSLNSLGNVTYFIGDYEQAQKYFEESLELRREIGDKYGIASSLGNLGNLAYYRGDYLQAQMYFEESLILSRDLKANILIAGLLFSLGGVALSCGDYEQARKYYAESLILYRETGDKHGIAESLNGLGILATSCGDYEQAQVYHEESLIISREIEFKLAISISLCCLGNVAYKRKDYKQAQKFHKESLVLSRELGYKTLIINSLICVSGIYLFNKNYYNAVKLLSAVETSLESMIEILFKDEQKNKDEITAILREHLSDEEFEKYWDEGSKLTLDEAAQLAVSS